MQYQDFSVRDFNDDGDLFLREWLPDTTPTDLICLIHGQSEHSGRYKHLAEFFVERNIGVLAIDLIGHGNSYGKRGHVKAMTGYLDNVRVLLREALNRHPNSTKFIYGHSMGGNIVANYALSSYFNTVLAGVVLTSPWLKLAFKPPAFKEKLGSIMRHILPSYSEKNELTGEGLSRDPEVVKAYVNDPLVHGSISVGAYTACKEGGLFALENASKLPKRTLVLHGNADPVTSHTASKDFVQTAGGLATYIEFENAYHELHNDLIWEEALGSIYEWMNN